MSDSVRPHRLQPTRLLHLWYSPGKNNGVGCHLLLQCMKVESESEVAQSCLTLSDPTDCSLPVSSIRGIFRAGILEWGAIAFSMLYIKSTELIHIIIENLYFLTTSTISPKPLLLAANNPLSVSMSFF